MSDLDHMLAWCIEIRRDEMNRAAQPGRMQLDRGWLGDARVRAMVAVARAPRLALMAKPSWDHAQLQTLSTVGGCRLAGVPIEVVEACEPPLRYLPHRDPLLFGAGA